MKNTKQPIYDRSNLIDFKDINKDDKKAETVGTIMASLLMILFLSILTANIMYLSHLKELDKAEIAQQKEINLYVEENHSELNWEELK